MIQAGEELSHGTKIRQAGGYAAFSVSRSQLEAVVRSIENQEEHHWRISFQDESTGNS